jgi:hypothetical protein
MPSSIVPADDYFPGASFAQGSFGEGDRAAEREGAVCRPRYADGSSTTRGM